jgi:hypothetical protein
VDITDDMAAQCDRRSILRRVGLAAGLGGAAALAGPLLVGQQAEAADGQSLLIGSANTGSTTTKLTSSGVSGVQVLIEGESFVAFEAAVGGSAVAKPGVAGRSSSNDGVFGQSEASVGVHGTSGGPLGPDGIAGVYGQCIGGAGVLGRSYGVGVSGESYTPSGLPRSSGVIGVVGDSGDGDGVVGLSTRNGVYGHATSATGVGVRASGTAGAAALMVSGVAKFSRSGVATVGAGAAHVTVRNVALTSASFVLATVQGNVLNNGVRSVLTAPGSSSLTIYLQRAVSANTKVAWFVLH